MLLGWTLALLALKCHVVGAVNGSDSGSPGNLLRGVTVPQYAFAGGQATLSCSYDLRATRLYSLKWYHNSTEFYRYVPTERNAPINIKPTHKFSVTELFRNDQRVTLSLTRLSVSASGHYRCEVIAESPSFRTEWYRATMTVLREPLSAPVLVGAREEYEPTELIKIGCQPRRPFHGNLQPSLQWYLQGTQVEPDWVSAYGTSLHGGPSGLSLHVPGEQVSAAGGQVVAECRLTLGPHQLSTNTTIKVKLRAASYLHNLHAAGSQRAVTNSGFSAVLTSASWLSKSSLFLTSGAAWVTSFSWLTRSSVLLTPEGTLLMSGAVLLTSCAAQLVSSPWLTANTLLPLFYPQ
ncbi:uncharacterized protein [Procambarus clarkii]|uniref:uncharacterized protein isoform X2 n=1 Tax=Procambarus clarkii TaxID=6728 RepID=UPI001E671DE3|nr:uncharacterized protein LOC123771711 isoform X2 [Procambarus clarkii]